MLKKSQPEPEKKPDKVVNQFANVLREDKEKIGMWKG